MSEIDEILAAYDYAETVTDTLRGGIEITVAEAHPMRNRAFSIKMQEIVQREGVDAGDISEDSEIEIFCDTLLKGWSAKKGGKPIPISEAHIHLSGSRAGRLLFREASLLALNHDRFLNGASKKKEMPSKSTPKASSSAKTSSSSKSKPKPAASRSRRASKGT